jgi:NitT/TauT family transport system substrate-binding protein
MGCTQVGKTEDVGTEQWVSTGVNIATLSGLPAVAISKLYKESPVGDNSITSYGIEYTRDELYSALIEGDPDIAIVTPDMAARAYNKNGKYKVIGTVGMSSAYLVSSDAKVNSISDLRGKEVSVFSYTDVSQNLSQIALEENGIMRGDIDLKTIDVSSYAGTEQDIIDDEIDEDNFNGFIPEPLLTNVLQNVKNIRIVKSLNDSWMEENQGARGCPEYSLVMKTDFIKANENIVETFTKELSESIDWANKNPDQVVKLLKDKDFLKDEFIDSDTIERSNLKFMPIDKMVVDYNDYYKQIFCLDSVYEDERVPDDSMYYIED